LSASDWRFAPGRSAIQRRCAVLSLDCDPIIAPIERKVVRAGRNSGRGPRGRLAVIVIGGILLLTAIDMIRLEV